HGANRLGGNALAETQVFGRRAGLFAGKEPVRDKGFSDSVIFAVIKELEDFLHGDTAPHIIRTRLQEAMWKGAGIFRNRTDLEQTLTQIESLDNITLKASHPTILAECCIVRNMLTTARLIVTSALIREESRGAHVRTDITQDWDATSSPFGHTRIRRDTKSIDRRGEA
ncbi:MAG: fumarate reductase subunit A, partial [Methanomicrobiales archaeon HGW-Methanomicrobiales-4]